MKLAIFFLFIVYIINPFIGFIITIILLLNSKRIKDQYFLSIFIAIFISLLAAAFNPNGFLVGDINIYHSWFTLKDFTVFDFDSFDYSLNSTYFFLTKPFFSFISYLLQDNGLQFNIIPFLFTAIIYQSFFYVVYVLSKETSNFKLFKFLILFVILFYNPRIMFQSFMFNTSLSLFALFLVTKNKKIRFFLTLFSLSTHFAITPFFVLYYLKKKMHITYLILIFCILYLILPGLFEVFLLSKYKNYAFNFTKSSKYEFLFIIEIVSRLILIIYILSFVLKKTNTVPERYISFFKNFIFFLPFLFFSRVLYTRFLHNSIILFLIPYLYNYKKIINYKSYYFLFPFLIGAFGLYGWAYNFFTPAIYSENNSSDIILFSIFDYFNLNNSY